MPELEPGDIVKDREHASLGVVINYVGASADDWYVDGRGLLAHDNPDYPSDADVVAIVHMNEVEERIPYYCGIRELPLTILNEHDIKWYAFPRPRLQKVEERDTVDVDPTEIRPSPYHSRNFVASENREYIDTIEDRVADDPPLLWASLDENEPRVINGHKRTWACLLREFDEIPTRCVYTNEYNAARGWAKRHLDDYDEEQREVAEDRIRSDWGEKAKAVIGDE